MKDFRDLRESGISSTGSDVDHDKKLGVSWVESVLDDETLVTSSSSRWKSWVRKNSDGWRLGIVLCAAGTFLVFIVNATVAALAIAKYGFRTFDVGKGQLVLYEGSCTVTRNANIGIHLVINIFSTVILASCNVCMQCLLAPTREEVDEAHAKNEWLDIGIQSFHNLWRIKRKRTWIWLLLGLSSLPLHLL